MFARLGRSAARPIRCSLEVECLEDRCVPNAANILAPVKPLIADIHTALADARSDVRALTAELASSASTAVKNDLSALASNLSSLNVDLSTGASVGPLSAAIAAQAQLTTDLGTNIRPTVERHFANLGAALSIIASDVPVVRNDAAAAVMQIDNDVTALTNTLDTIGVGASMQRSVASLTVDVDRMVSDLETGDVKGVLAEAKSAFRRIAQVAALGDSVAPAIEPTLTDLGNDVRGVAEDLAGATPFEGHALAAIESDA